MKKRFIIKDIGNKVKRSELYNGIKIRVALTGGDYIYVVKRTVDQIH